MCKYLIFPNPDVESNKVYKSSAVLKHNFAGFFFRLDTNSISVENNVHFTP